MALVVADVIPNTGDDDVVQLVPANTGIPAAAAAAVLAVWPNTADVLTVAELAAKAAVAAATLPAGSADDS